MTMKNVSHQDNPWPDLPLNSWQDTYATLHMWLQIAGKIALTLAPMTNHWWQTTLAVSSRGLTTSLLPCGERIFQIDFDFIDHQMRITADSGDTRAVALKPRSVADFYDETMRALRSIGIEVSSGQPRLRWKQEYPLSRIMRIQRMIRNTPDVTGEF